jgi:hypothetical protein
VINKFWGERIVEFSFHSSFSSSSKTGPESSTAEARVVERIPNEQCERKTKEHNISKIMGYNEFSFSQKRTGAVMAILEPIKVDRAILVFKSISISKHLNFPEIKIDGNALRKLSSDVIFESDKDFRLSPCSASASSVEPGRFLFFPLFELSILEVDEQLVL